MTAKQKRRHNMCDVSFVLLWKELVELSKFVV